MTVTIRPDVAAESLGIDVYSLGFQLRMAASREIERLGKVIGDAVRPGGARLDELDEEFERAFNLLRAAEACDDHWRRSIDEAMEGPDASDAD